MEVKNYYALSPKDLDYSIQRIRDFLFNYPDNERYLTAIFALNVALCAKELKRDAFVDLVLESLVFLV